jgi:hypothetical protein
MKNFMICTSSNITPVIKSRRRKCLGHVALMGENGSEYMVLVGKT